MNGYRISGKIIVLPLIVFFLCFLKIATADEKISPAPAAGIKSSAENIPLDERPSIKPEQDKLKHNTLGCLIPLSGTYAEYGRKASDAILLAMENFNEAHKTKWEVIFEDSGETEEAAKTAIANLASNKNMTAIIAIAGTSEAMEIAREAAKGKVPGIMITSKQGVTTAGENIFQHFLTPDQEIRALVKYAFQDLNCAIFSVLYPDDDYGRDMLKIFREEVRRIEGKVERTIPYDTNQTDFAREINKLSARAVKDKSKPVAVDFEALFIPDSHARVKLIASQLDFYHVKGFQLLGTSLWNSPDLLKGDASYLENAVFTDSYFKDSYNLETSNFVFDFSKAYEREPGNIEALAYDTAGMIFRVIGDNDIKTISDFTAGLMKMGSYRGATGNTYFDKNRVSRKTSFLLEVRKGKLNQMN